MPNGIAFDDPKYLFVYTDSEKLDQFREAFLTGEWKTVQLGWSTSGYKFFKIVVVLPYHQLRDKHTRAWLDLSLKQRLYPEGKYVEIGY